MNILSTKSEGSLPLPAISSSVRVSVSRPRRRFALAVFAFVALFSFGRLFRVHSYFFFVRDQIPSIEYPSLPSLANPDSLPIYWGLRKPEPVHPLRPSMVDPWPDHPEIASLYFASDRPVFDPLVIPFPTEDDGLDSDNKPSVLTKISFDSIEPPQSWSRESSPGNLGERKRLNKVQWSGFTKLADKERQQVSEQRLEWVRRAMRHGWEGYKYVLSSPTMTTFSQLIFYLDTGNMHGDMMKYVLSQIALKIHLEDGAPVLLIRCKSADH